MASNSLFSPFLASFLLLSATIPLTASGQLLDRTLIVTGQVCCVANGNCVARSPPLVGARTNLHCSLLGLGEVTVSGGITTATGNFTITVKGGLDRPIRNLLVTSCVVRIPLPVSGCGVLAAGTLVSAPITITSPYSIGQTTIRATAARFSVK